MPGRPPQAGAPEAGDDRPTLYTIGYEGLCVEQYVSRLREAKVSMLVDVRHNSVKPEIQVSQFAECIRINL